MIHSLPCGNPRGLYIHLAFTYSFGPSSVVWSELGLAPPSSTNASAWSVMVTGSQSPVWSGPQVAFCTKSLGALQVVNWLGSWQHSSEHHTWRMIQWMLTYLLSHIVKYHTKYCIECHMLFYVIVVTFLVKLQLNRFTNIFIPTYLLTYSASKCQLSKQSYCHGWKDTYQATSIETL